MFRFLAISLFCLFALYHQAKAAPNFSPNSRGSMCTQTAQLAKNAQFQTPAGEWSADFLVVDKARRLLHLLKAGKISRTYKMHLGKKPVGKKRQEGDKKTPEGWYSIGYKNSASDFHLSLQISYPNQDDINWARENGVDPGGDIMIHGTPNGVPSFLVSGDWTSGCVAVKNKEIEEIWKFVKTGTDIELCP
jgi:murein L,D-transpeptidase YafK